MNIGKISKNLVNLQTVNIKSSGREIPLKKIFGERLVLSPDTYNKMQTIVKSQIIGQLPKGLLQIVIKAQGNKSKNFKQVFDTFISAAKCLSGINQIEVEALEKRSKDLSELIKIKKPVHHSIELPKLNIFSQPLEQYGQTSKILEEGLKGILPENTKINLKHIGGGFWGNAYKISFLNKNEENIIPEIVLKSFKSEKQILRNEISLRTTIKTLNEIYPDSEHPNFKSRKTDVLQRGMQVLFNMLKEHHGPYPEANATQYIRRIAGHKLVDKDNLLLPDVFVLCETPFSLARFSNFEKPPTRFFNFNKFGIVSTDTDRNVNNTVCGRIIDFGGMKNILGGMLQDKTVMKYYKKFVNKPKNEAYKLISRYVQVSKTTNDLIFKKRLNRAIDMALRYFTSCDE